jgi:hypothetical protein
MSTKDLHNNKNISLLDLIEQASELKRSDIYKALGWSRQRYYEARKSETLPLKTLKQVRIAANIPALQFYAIIESYLSK